MNALVSIIVPVYNNEKFLNKCLSSIQSQTYENIQVIVVDDGSTDKSRDIAERFAASDQRFLCISQANRGVAAARNLALSYASGKYYLFIDGDDYIGKNYVNSLAARAEETKSELVICGYTLVYPHKRKMVRVVPDSYIPYIREEWAYRICAVCCRLYLGTFWKKHALEFVSEPHARAEDIPAAMYANAMASDIQVVSSADYYYVQHDASAMHQKTGGVPFYFPYESFGRTYQKLRNSTFVNSRFFWDMGVLKFIAQFEFVIYRNAEKQDYEKFRGFVCRLLSEDWNRIVSEWKQDWRKVRFPFMHKMAMGLLICRYQKFMLQQEQDLKR